MLQVRIIDVWQQTNGSDCGVLAIALALAFDICCGKDPCSVRFDHKSIRHHLAMCLENSKFIRFPAKFLWYKAYSENWTSLFLRKLVLIKWPSARFGIISTAWIYSYWSVWQSGYSLEVQKMWISEILCHPEIWLIDLQWFISYSYGWLLRRSMRGW